jgi:hypothetical protein
MKIRLGLVSALLCFSFAGITEAAPGGKGKAAGSAASAIESGKSSDLLSTKQRVDLAREIGRRWGPEVRKQGNDVRAWGAKLGRVIAGADPMNVLEASQMPSLETMHAALAGQPIDSPIMQASIRKTFAKSGGVTAKTLGSTIADTVYTPLPNGRCRVADSRVIASPLPGGVERGIDVEDISSYAAYGGNGTFASGDGSTNCGIPSFATAVAVSVTVLSTGSEGIFKIYENGKPYQTGSTIYYTGVVSAANDMIVTSCQSCAEELRIFSSGPVNYVIDVVGYFIPPEATALQCVEIESAGVNVNAGSFGTQSTQTCPTDYTITGGGCSMSSFDGRIVTSRTFASTSSQTHFCAFRNEGASTIEGKAYSRCCRTPGR